jgi:membrane associated rhomboid family serine protease
VRTISEFPLYSLAYAPVTKAIVIAVVATTLFASIAGTHPKLALDASDVLQHGAAWRLFTHNFLFSTPGELLFGVVLLYYLRQFERQMGSSRFFAFVTMSAVLYSAQMFLVDLALDRKLVLSSGPYAFILASMVRFFFETPKLYEFQVFGSMSLSDKSFPYLLAVQLVFSSLPQSLICLACGIVGGLVLRLPALQSYIDTPAPLVSLASTTILPFMDTIPSNRARARRSSRRGRMNPQLQQEIQTRPRENGGVPASPGSNGAGGPRGDGTEQAPELNAGSSSARGYERE